MGSNNALYIFIPLLIGLTIGFGIILGSSSRDDVMAHWPERRCDFEVVLAAFMFKPADDKSSSFEFSANNFKFCVGSKVEEYLKTLFGSLFGILEKQMDVANIMTNVMKIIRAQLNSIYEPFSLLMTNFWNKFRQIGTLGSRIFQHLYMSMKKAAATAVASLFIAISLQTALLNGIDLVIKVIMIVLYILLALAVIFFLPILPVLVFVFLATAGIEEIYPGRTGGMGTVFCFAPDTPVVVEGGGTCKISKLKVGTRLRDLQIVEAVIETPGSDTLYTIHGTVVSGDHRVLENNNNRRWVFVKDHPDAILTRVTHPTLWTLITSNRQIPVLNSISSIQIYSDWEEIPDTKESAIVWESIAQKILNPRNVSHTNVQNAPCLDRLTLIERYQSGLVPISEISRGDWIMDLSWTRVIGICKRKVQGGFGKIGSRMTDGVWIWDSKTSSWIHPIGDLDTRAWEGYTLLTESGSFMIRNNGKVYRVRDFTEVGWMNLEATYARVEMAMENKKDSTKEE